MDEFELEFIENATHLIKSYSYDELIRQYDMIQKQYVLIETCGDFKTFPIRDSIIKISKAIVNEIRCRKLKKLK